MMKNNVCGVMLLIVVCFGTLTVTAKAGANLSVTISPPSPVIIVKSTSKVFTATVVGGTPPYQFSWTLYDNLKVPVASGTGNPWNCTVPKYAFVGIGNVTVYVTDSQGDVGFTTEPVLILALYVSVSPASATLDVGQSQAFSSFVIGGTSPYSYQWYFDGSSVSGADGASWTYTPSSFGSHAVYVNVKDAASDAATSNIVLVTVNAALSTGILPTSATLDVGQSQTFTSSTSGGTSPFTYQWYLDSSAVSGATSSYWICSPLEPGSHTVCVKVTDCASTPATAPSNTASVVVNSAPSVIIAPASSTMDIGQSEQFTSSTYGGTSPCSYEWYLNGTLISGITSSSYTFTPSSRGHYNFYCNVTDSANVRAQSNTATVVVNSALSASISQSSFTLDVGQSQTLTSAINGGTSPYTYQWCINSSAIGGAKGASYTFTPSSHGNYTFYLNVTDGARSEAQSSTVTATVNSALLLTISPTSATLDLGQSQNFSSSTSAGTSPYSYQWYLDGSMVKDATSSTWTFAPTSSGSYSIYLNVTDKVGLKVKSDVATVTVNTALSVSISPTDVVVDDDQSRSFTSTVSGGTSPYTYQWYLNGVAESGATNASWTFTASLAGPYIIYLKVMDSVSASAMSNTATIMVNSAPSVTISPTSAALDVGQSQIFASNVSGGTGSHSYQWYLNGTPASNATGATWSLTPSATGSYNVYVVITDSLRVNATSNAAAVTVNGALSVTTSPSPVLIDVGQFQLFTSSVAGGTFPYSYQWYLNGQAVGTGVTYNFSAQAVGSDSIYATVTDSASNPNTATSNTANVTVNSAPSVDVSPSSWIMDVGQSQTFMATASGGSGTYLFYQWYVDGQPQSSKVSTFVYSSSTASLGPRSITVTVTDSSGVTSPKSSPATITVNAALIAPALTFLPSTVDRGQTSVLSNSTVISTGTGPYSYQWFEMAPGASVYSMIAGANLTSYSFVTSVPTDVGVWYFRLDVTDATGAVVTSNVGLVRVNLVPSVSISPSSATLDVGQSQLFASSVSNGTPPYYYQWYLDGVAVGTNRATWNFTFSYTGTFIVCLNVTDHEGLFASGTAIAMVKLHDVAVTNVMPSKTQVVEFDRIYVNITVKNEGNYAETFNVTLYESLHGYSLPIYTFTNVTLAPGSTTTLTIAGLGLGLGFYTLSVHVYNAYFSNTYTGGTVCVMTPAGLRLWNWIYQGSYSSWRYGPAIPV
jgi:hypothetical protein